MDIFLLILCGIAGYLLGSINSSLVIGKFYGRDVRQFGSGNAGTTNTLRVLGKKAAGLVLVGDILKGIAAYLIGRYINGDVGAMIAGVASILGHNWPVYFGFKGGKGALTSISVIFMMDWRIGLILVGVFILVVALTRYVSLGSVIGAVLFPFIAFFLFEKNTEFLVLSLFLALIVIARHHANIKRLLKGTESKLGQKKDDK